MTTVRRVPLISIWVPGKPRSLQSGSRARYMTGIRREAAKQISKPLASGRIDIDVLFSAKAGNPRADVDNVAKPVLDALKGVVYHDDRQVRSMRVLFLPQDDVVDARGSLAVHLRLNQGEEFLINVYEGRHIETSIVERRAD